MYRDNLYPKSKDLGFRPKGIFDKITIYIVFECQHGTESYKEYSSLPMGRSDSATGGAPKVFYAITFSVGKATKFVYNSLEG